MSPADIARDFPGLYATWQAMAKLPLPRNAQPLVDRRRAGKLDEGAHFVVSFGVITPLRLPHVFVDPGRRYDWRFAANLRATVVTQRGVDFSVVVKDLFRMTDLYPTLIDFDQQILASIVDKPGGGFKLWPRARGSQPWQAVFGGAA